MDLKTALEIASFIFLAGGGWVAIKEHNRRTDERLLNLEQSLRGNVNGIGGKTNKIILFLQETAGNEETRRRITDLFK